MWKKCKGYEDFLLALYVHSGARQSYKGWQLLSITCLICQFSIWSQKELIHNKKTDVWCLPAFESSLFAAITALIALQVLKTSICVSVSSNGRRNIICQALETPSRKPVFFFSRNTYQIAWKKPSDQKTAHLSPWWDPTIAENRPFSSESTSPCVTVIDRERWNGKGPDITISPDKIS